MTDRCQSDSGEQESAEEAERVRHALRRIRLTVDTMLPGFERWLHLACPAPVTGAMTPEQTIRALALQAIWGSPRSCTLIERIWSTAAYRDFVGVQRSTPRWDSEVFSRYRNQLLDHYLIHRFLIQVLQDAAQEELLGASSLRTLPPAAGESHAKAGSILPCGCED